MKKLTSFVAVMLLTLAVLPAAPVMAADLEYKETPLDQAWDWATTVGKSGTQKDEVLARNKAERMKRHAEKVAKQAQKDAEKAAGDMKKKMGF